MVVCVRGCAGVHHRMINQCLQSVSTQVNFFFHNLAQMKFSGHDDGTLLSFIPKTYRLLPPLVYPSFRYTVPSVSRLLYLHFCIYLFEETLCSIRNFQ